MKTPHTLITLILFIVVLSASFGWATTPVPHTEPFYYSFKPISSDLATGRVDLLISFKPIDTNFGICGKIEVASSSKDKIRFVGDPKFDIIFDDVNAEITFNLELYLPPRDTSRLDLEWLCTGTGHGGTVPYYFVNTSDSIEFWNFNPRTPGQYEKYKWPKSSRLDRDTLKASDLDVKYEVYLNQRASDKVRTTTEILGFEPKKEWDGYSRVTLPLGQLLALRDAGVSWEFAVFPDWAGPHDTTYSHMRHQQPKPPEIRALPLGEDEAKRLQMRRLEQSPLKDKASQGFMIDGEMWHGYPTAWGLLKKV